MSKLAWLTPDEIPSDNIRRWLCIPNTPALIACVTGALLPLAYEENWEAHGDVTPANAALAMSLMLEEFLAQQGACFPMLHPPIIIADVKTQNTDGGAFNSGAWRIRDLNSLGDVLSIGASLTNNEFTLPAGNWFIKWSCPARMVTSHMARLWSVTENTAIAYGSSGYCPNADNEDRSIGMAFQNNSSPTTYRIEHRCTVTRATDGFGVATNLSTELYTQVEAYLMS